MRVPQLEEVLFHKKTMLLLDEIHNHGDDWIEVVVRIAEDSLFFENARGVPAWVGLEYMAQAVAAYIGVISNHENQPPQPGLLLGTRAYKYCGDIAYFPLGAKLIVCASKLWHDDEIGSFSCHIQWKEQKIVQARLVVFKPKDLELFKKGEGN